MDLFANAMLENEEEHSFADDLTENSGLDESETEINLSQSKKTDLSNSQEQMFSNSDNESQFDESDSEEIVFRSSLVESSSSLSESFVENMILLEKNAPTTELDISKSSSLLEEENNSLRLNDEIGPLQEEFKEKLSLKESSSEEINKYVAQENIDNNSPKENGNTVETAEFSPVVQPNCISEYDFFLKNMGTEMREEDPDDYDFVEKIQAEQTFEPLQGIEPSSWARRFKQQRSPLLPTPAGSNQANFSSRPPGQFVPPIQGAHGQGTVRPLSVQQQQWVDYWQMAFLDFWSNYNVGRTTVGGGSSAFPEPPQFHQQQQQLQLHQQQQQLHQQVPVGPSSSIKSYQPQQQSQWNGDYQHGNANSAVPMSRDQNSAYEFYGSTAYNNEAAHSARNQYQLQQQQHHHQPLFNSNNYSTRGSIHTGQMKTAGNNITAGRSNNNNTGSYKGRVFFNHGNGNGAGGGGGRNGGGGNQWSQHSEKGGDASGKHAPTFFEQEALLEQKNASTKGGGDDFVAAADDGWYEFDSSEDLRPSRGHFASDARGAGGHQRGNEGGYASNKSGVPHRGGSGRGGRGGGGGYGGRPPMVANNHFNNKNSKNFY